MFAIMIRKLFALFFLLLLSLSSAVPAAAQRKEIAQAKDNVKAGKKLAEAEASMRHLLADSANRNNDKIWLVLFDAVRKQYEALNEQMYLKQTTDTASLFDVTYRLFGVLEGLDSVDARPDRKGRVELKYRRKHASWLNTYRRNLQTGGLFFMAKGDYLKAWTYFDAYIDCARQPLFSSYNLAQKDPIMPKVAFNAVFCGHRASSPEKTLAHADLAQADTARLDIVCRYMADAYRQQADTTACLAVLHKGFDAYPKSDYFFSHLFDYYFRSADTCRALSLCDRALKADSLSFVARFAKSSVLLLQGRYDECLVLSDALIAADSTKADPYLNAALAYYNQAVALDNKKLTNRTQRRQMQQLYRKALPYMERYRKLAPDAQLKWAMPLYTIYLNLNMGKEFEEIDGLMKKAK